MRSNNNVTNIASVLWQVESCAESLASALLPLMMSQRIQIAYMISIALLGVAMCLRVPPALSKEAARLQLVSLKTLHISYQLRLESTLPWGSSWYHTMTACSWL